jgi:hypothetical protein
MICQLWSAASIAALGFFFVLGKKATKAAMLAALQNPEGPGEPPRVAAGVARRAAPRPLQAPAGRDRLHRQLELP